MPLHVTPPGSENGSLRGSLIIFTASAFALQLTLPKFGYQLKKKRVRFHEALESIDMQRLKYIQSKTPESVN